MYSQSFLFPLPVCHWKDPKCRTEPLLLKMKDTGCNPLSLRPKTLSEVPLFSPFSVLPPSSSLSVTMIPGSQVLRVVRPHNMRSNNTRLGVIMDEISFSSSMKYLRKTTRSLCDTSFFLQYQFIQSNCTDIVYDVRNLQLCSSGTGTSSEGLLDRNKLTIKGLTRRRESWTR